MSLRIATNTQALAAQRYLNINHDNQNKSLEKLSSGSRINRAGDDAAGLAISEKLKANIRSMKQATRNANDGISLVQTAEGAMNEVGNILIRMRELSIQGASDTIGDTERGFIDKEVQHLKEEIDRISNSTEFNGTKLLNGTSPARYPDRHQQQRHARSLRLRLSGPQHHAERDGARRRDDDDQGELSAEHGDARPCDH